MHSIYSHPCPQNVEKLKFIAEISFKQKEIKFNSFLSFFSTPARYWLNFLLDVFFFAVVINKYESKLDISSDIEVQSSFFLLLQIPSFPYIPNENELFSSLSILTLWFATFIMGIRLTMRQIFILLMSK